MISPQRKKVALLVSEHVGEHDVVAARELLEALGLVDGPGARELADDPPGLPMSAHDRVGHDVVLAELPARPSTTPPGLLLAPVAPVPPGRRPASARPAPAQPAGEPAKRMGRTATAECGTRSGYQRHRRVGQTPCQPCRAAAAAYERARQAAARAARPAVARRVAACGTVSGYSRHKRDGQKPCAPCHDALLADHRARRASRAAR